MVTSCCVLPRRRPDPRAGAGHIVLCPAPQPARSCLSFSFKENFQSASTFENKSVEHENGWGIMWFRRKPHVLMDFCKVPGGRLAQCPRGVEPNPTDYIQRFCGSDSRGDNEFKLKNLPLPVRRGEYRKGDVGSPNHCRPSR